MDNKNFAEFFAGIGLVRAGLESSGWKCVYANDIDQKKHEMYQHRFGKSKHYHVEDIWNTPSVYSEIKNDISLATASFPCVDLSLAGNRKGLKGKQSGSFHGFLKVLTKLRSCQKEPNILLIENVMGFLTANNGNDFDFACTELSKLGYWIDCISVDAKFFTPQSRPRIFLIACKKDCIPQEATTYQPNNLLSRWIQIVESQPHVRSKKIIQSLISLKLKTGVFSFELPDFPDEKHDIGRLLDPIRGEWWDSEKVDKHLNEMSEAHKQRIETLSASKTTTLGTMYRRVRNGKSRTEIRTDGLAGCLRTPRGGSSKQMVFAAGGNKIKMRWMLPVEYAALQGAPDFPINVGTTQALFGFGDAVCVPAIEWIGRHYLEVVLAAHKKEKKEKKTLEIA